ncbi:hypothetical protein SDC9_162282 [bioreactor metagenome]|uniref:Uncharacterized protein n=1 Tax=bioreactor metagenome TaxID=1076179 RepID=A0A645FS98_9ZZZZ
MPNTAGIACVVHARRKVGSHRAVAGRDELHLALGELGRFLQSDHVVFLPLILKYILLVVAISEFDAAAVRKRKYALRLVVVHKTRKFRLQRPHVVLGQLRQRPPEQ